jgi:cell division protein FtsW (lipid II flippase)
MRRTFKYLDKPLLFVTIFLFIFGLVMVFSASNVTAYMSQAVSPYNYFFKQLFFLIVGLVAAIIMICIPMNISIMNQTGKKTGTETILISPGIAALKVKPEKNPFWHFV